MKQFITTTIAIAFGLLLASAPARAAEQATPGITVKNAWIRATPNGAKVAGGYATITNTGTVADRLTGVAIPLAPKAEIHEMSMENGVMKMRELDKGLDIPAGATVTLQPSGFHIMFLNPTAPFKEGDTVTGTLTFEKAGAVPVSFTVTGMGAKAAPGGAMQMNHMHMDMK